MGNANIIATRGLKLGQASISACTALQARASRAPDCFNALTYLLVTRGATLFQYHSTVRRRAVLARDKPDNALRCLLVTRRATLFQYHSTVQRRTVLAREKPDNEFDAQSNNERRFATCRRPSPSDARAQLVEGGLLLRPVARSALIAVRERHYDLCRLTDTV